MGIYDVDYSKTTVQTLPPDKRYKANVAWIRALAAPLQWLRDLWMGSYGNGSTAVAWVPVATYKKYDRVLYKQKVYESLIDSNTVIPTDRTSWMVVQQNFIGVFERVLYNGNKLNLEYALNKYFGAIFRQPPGVSDIYLTATQKPFSVFVVGGSDKNSSVIYDYTSSQFVINQYNFNAYFNLTIMVPAALYASLDIDPANSNRIIRNYADQYIVAGIIYQISTY